MQRLSYLLLAGGLLALLALAPAATAGTEHIVEVKDNLFEPATLNISAGDTVKFVWNQSNSNSHNVAQVDDENDENYNGGFRSGDPQSTGEWTLPASYTAGNDTLYYICEPHVSIGMRGKIVIGDGVPPSSNGDGNGDGDDDAADDEDTPGFSGLELLIGGVAAAVLVVGRRKRSLRLQ